MENTDNQNTQYHIAHTKLLKSSFPGASGNKKVKSANHCVAMICGFFCCNFTPV